MAKKKKKVQDLKKPTPENYIKSRARNLEISECFITTDWRNTRLAHMVVVRKHNNGNRTIGLFKVDLLCKGIIDTSFAFNVGPGLYEDLKDRNFDLDEKLEFKPVSYTLIHNIVWGAAEFAADCGLKPHRDFEVTKYILEELSYKYSYIEIEFGYRNEPIVVEDFHPDWRRLVAHLTNFLEEKEFHIYHMEQYEHLMHIPLELSSELYDRYTDEEIGRYLDKSEKPDEEFLEAYIGHSFAIRKLASDDLSSLQDGKPVYDIDIEEYTFAEHDHDHFNLTEEDKKFGLRVYDELENPKKKKLGKIIKELEGLLKEKKEHPFYFNMLALAYRRAEMDDKTRETMEEIIRQFPDYIFGKLSYAEYLIDKEEEHKIGDLFGHKFQLFELYPEKKEFKPSELELFLHVCSWYFLSDGNIFSADNYFKAYRQLAEERTEMKYLKNELLLRKIKFLYPEEVDQMNKEKGE